MGSASHRAAPKTEPPVSTFDTLESVGLLLLEAERLLYVGMREEPFPRAKVTSPLVAAVTRLRQEQQDLRDIARSLQARRL